MSVIDLRLSGNRVWESSSASVLSDRVNQSGFGARRAKVLNQGIIRMIHKAKDLSPDQRVAIEDLLGRAIGENEKIIIRTADTPTPPEWLRRSWETAQEHGLDRLSEKEIDAEIAAVRKARRKQARVER